MLNDYVEAVRGAVGVWRPRLYVETNVTVHRLKYVHCGFAYNVGEISATIIFLCPQDLNMQRKLAKHYAVETCLGHPFCRMQSRRRVFKEGRHHDFVGVCLKKACFEVGCYRVPSIDFPVVSCFYSLLVLLSLTCYVSAICVYLIFYTHCYLKMH